MMFIERLQVKGLLSFGPDGIDLPLEPLNVIIGPNGSGKSNLLKVLGLLKAAPVNLSQDAMKTGNVRDWFWRPHRYDSVAAIDVTAMSLFPTQHSLTIAPDDDHFQVRKEKISYTKESSSSLVVRTDMSGKVFGDCSDTPLEGLTLRPGQSLLSLEHRLPIDMSREVEDMYRMITLLRLNWLYQSIQLRRDWIYGDSAPSRRIQSAESSSFDLAEHGDNLAIVLSGFSASNRDELTKYLNRFYDGIVGISTPVSDGKVSLLLEESGGRQIPAAQLSDGTLRYLHLLTVLMQPTPPPLIGIEEPELGLHPDAIYDLAELLVDTSKRTQLVVTTHSPTLIDALTAYPSSVVACEKYEGQTRFRRVNPEALASWIGDQGLGEVWAGGGIGGNRW